MTAALPLAALRRAAPGSVIGLVVGCLLVTAAVLLQVSGIGEIDVLGGRPDLVVLAIVAIGLERGPVPAAAAGFAAGLALDLLGLGLVGSTSIALVVVGYLVGIYGERLSRRARVRPLLVAAAAALGASLLVLLVAALVGEAPRAPRLLLTSSISSGLLAVPLAILLLPLARRALRRRVPAPSFDPGLAPEPSLRVDGPPAVVLEAARAVGPVERVVAPAALRAAADRAADVTEEAPPAPVAGEPGEGAP